VTSRVRWLATLFAGLGILGFVFLNYQDPWPPFVERPLEPEAPPEPPQPEGTFRLDAPHPGEPESTSETDTEPTSASQPPATPVSPRPEPGTDALFAAAAAEFAAAGVEPVYVAGALTGVLVKSVPRDSLFDRSGLQRGDVVRTVNGMSLDDADAAAVLADQIMAEIPLEVRVEREDGTTRTLSIPVHELLGGGPNDAKQPGASAGVAPGP
jgi:hypothetical protein